MPLEFKPFDHNDSDAFAGACNFKDGKPPLICHNANPKEYVTACTIIIAGDPDGLEHLPVMAECFFQSESDEQPASYMQFFNTIDEARGYLLAVADLDGCISPTALKNRKWQRGA